MKTVTLIELVDELTGRCYPYGDTLIDEKRYDNLELKMALVEHLIVEIEEAGKMYERSEFSTQHIANRANSFLTDIRDVLLDIEYLPPTEPIKNKVMDFQVIETPTCSECDHYEDHHTSLACANCPVITKVWGGTKE